MLKKPPCIMYITQMLKVMTNVERVSRDHKTKLCHYNND